jgi:hypothetical protein
MRHGPHRICIGCYGYQRKYAHFYRQILFWLGSGFIAGLVFLESIWLGLLWAGIVYAIMYLTVVLHELGHAAAAWLVRMPVLAFSFGGGVRARAIRWRNSFVIVGPSPDEGFVGLAPKTSNLFRTKCAVVLFAGPLVNIVGFAAGAVALVNLTSATSDVLGILLLTWTFVNFIHIESLIPSIHQGAFGATSSDGRQLLRLHKLADEDVARIVDQVPETRARLAHWHGSFELAYRHVEGRIAANRMSSAGKVLATAILLESGRTQESIESARRYLGESGLEPQDRAMLQNNLAFALLVDQAPDLSESDALSQAAMNFLPMLPAVIGTRGSVLVERGEYREGIALLTDRRHRLASRDNRATHQAFIALAWAGLGKPTEAANALERARQLSPKNIFIPRATQRVTEAANFRPAAAPANPT